MASKIGHVKKMGQAIKFWYPYFGVLSGGYIYFYEKLQDLYPTDYFYIKGCQISKHESQEHSTMLVNSYAEQCFLAFSSKAHQQEWEKALQEKTFEMAQMLQQQQKAWEDKPAEVEVKDSNQILT
mmetsp:Transcript_23176/g.22649  ORF Transcript_23176/g.22649 Transcript_23176/m.22649 type:complete len:125 (-) Transcript_23176:204-578(-)